MKQWQKLVVAGLVCASTPAYSEDSTTTDPTASPGVESPANPKRTTAGMPDPVTLGRPSMLSWDLALVGGYAWSNRDDSSVMFGRLRAGAVWIDPPLAVAMGPTICAGGLGGTAWGGQLQVMNFAAGLWATGGAEKFFQQGGAKLNLAVGYSLFGVEWQRTFDRPSNSYGFVLELNIPVGLVYYLITH